MDCLKKIKLIQWIILAIVAGVFIYLATHNEHFTFSLHDSAGSLMLECPDKLNIFSKNWHKIQLNKNNKLINPQSLHPDNGGKQHIMAFMQCDPSGIQNVHNGLLDIANLLSQLNPNNTLAQTIDSIQKTHPQYSVAFNQLLSEFKNVTSNNTTTCTSSLNV